VDCPDDGTVAVAWPVNTQRFDVDRHGENDGNGNRGAESSGGGRGVFPV